MRKISIVPFVAIVLMYIIVCGLLALTSGITVLKQHNKQIQTIEQYIK